MLKLTSYISQQRESIYLLTTIVRIIRLVLVLEFSKKAQLII
jgi:hypothetical protein